MASTVDLDRIEETEASHAELEEQLDELAQLVRASKKTVFFTGAGVSTSAGVGDYRGPTGAWTMDRIKELARAEAGGRITEAGVAELAKLRKEAAKKRKDQCKDVPMLDAQPTVSHMAISTLIRRNLAHYVVTTNLDGIHRKSGLQAHTQIANLHGCVYAERCTGCGYDFERNYETRWPQIHVHDHHVGTCSRCGCAPPASYNGRPKHRNAPTGSDSNGFADNHLVGTQDEDCGTKDTHINFGEFLDDVDWKDAERACKGADLCIVAGTSMSLRHITHFPFMAKKVVIVNLQETPDDARADLRIFGKCDPIFAGLMRRLQVEVDPTPVWRPRDSVPLDQLPAELDPYYVSAARRLEAMAKKRETEAAQREEAKRAATKVQDKRREEEELCRSVSHVKLGNTHEVFRSGDNPSHDWKMQVACQDASGGQVGGAVESVTFHLHPTFTPSTVTVPATSGGQSCFEFAARGWGTFDVGVDINWRAEMAPTRLSHTLSFARPETSRIIAVQ